MAFSRIKEFLSRRAIRCIFILDSGQLLFKTKKYDKNNFIIHHNKGYIYSQKGVYFIRHKAYAFYYENDPCPITFPGSAPIVRSAELESLVNTKVVQEIVQGTSTSLIILVLVILNAIIGFIIMAKLWGLFDKAEVPPPIVIPNGVFP